MKGGVSGDGGEGLFMRRMERSLVKSWDIVALMLGDMCGMGLW